MLLLSNSPKPEMSTTAKAFSTSLLSLPKCLHFQRPICFSLPPRRLLRPLCTAAVEEAELLQPAKHSILLERLRQRHLKDSSHPSKATSPAPLQKVRHDSEGSRGKKGRAVEMASSFGELGLSEEVMGALGEMGITEPTEIQCIGILAVLDGKSVVLGSHIGSSKGQIPRNHHYGAGIRHLNP